MVHNRWNWIVFLSITLLLFCSNTLLGQIKILEDYDNKKLRKARENQSDLDSNRLYRPNWGIKYVPTELLVYTPGLQLGVEKKTTDHQAIGVDVTNLLNFRNTEGNFKGYKIGTEYRFYRHWKKGKKQNSFIGMRGEWKQSFLSGEGEFWRQNQNYREILAFRSITNTKNLFFIHGWMKRFKKHWAMETKLGYGVRFVHLLYKDVPADALRVDNDEEFFTTTIRRAGRYNFVNILVSWKVVYMWE